MHKQNIYIVPGDWLLFISQAWTFLSFFILGILFLFIFFTLFVDFFAGVILLFFLETVVVETKLES